MSSSTIEDQMTATIAIRIVGYFIAGFLTVGAMFAAANTMYAAVANRTREIGTLRALGFRRRSILSSFLLESVLLCLAGGILGCLATLPFNGLTTGTANWATFSEITFSFRFGPQGDAAGPGASPDDGPARRALSRTSRRSAQHGKCAARAVSHTNRVAWATVAIENCGFSSAWLA